MEIKKIIGNSAVTKLDFPFTENFGNEKRTYKYGVIIDYKPTEKYDDIDSDIFCETYRQAQQKAYQWQ